MNENHDSPIVPIAAGELDAGFAIFIGRYWKGVCKDPYQWSVFTHLVMYANHRSRECFPSLSRLSEDTGISRSQLIRSIQMLEQNGFISSKTRPGNSTLYKILRIPKEVKANAAKDEGFLPDTSFYQEPPPPPTRSPQIPTRSPQIPHPSPTDTTPVPTRHPNVSKEDIPLNVAHEDSSPAIKESFNRLLALKNKLKNSPENSAPSDHSS